MDKKENVAATTDQEIEVVQYRGVKAMPFVIGDYIVFFFKYIYIYIYIIKFQSYFSQILTYKNSNIIL